MHTTKRTRSSRKKVVWTSLVVVAGLCLVLLILELTGATHFTGLRSAPAEQTASQYTKGNDNSSSEDPSASHNNAPGPSNKPTDPENGNSPTAKSGDSPVHVSNKLIKPRGVFASNHSASLSQKGMDKEDSACNTTPGATCQIIFTKGSVVKKLPAQKVDRGGAAYWNWQLKDIDLTAGAWQVKAVATLGSQTLSRADAMELKISP